MEKVKLDNKRILFNLLPAHVAQHFLMSNPRNMVSICGHVQAHPTGIVSLKCVSTFEIRKHTLTQQVLQEALRFRFADLQVRRCLDFQVTSQDSHLFVFFSTILPFNVNVSVQCMYVGFEKFSFWFCIFRSLYLRNLKVEGGGKNLKSIHF